MEVGYTVTSVVGERVEVPGTSGSLEGCLADRSIPMEEVSDDMRALNLEKEYRVQLSIAEEAEVKFGKLVVSACHADIESRPRTQGDVFKAMIDGGANLNLGPDCLAKALHLEIVPHVVARRIGTADTTGHMIIKGWIFPRGFTGPIAIVERAAYTLLSVSELQKNGMGANCPPCRSVCELVIIDVDQQERVFISIPQQPPTNLYFVDVRKLMESYMPKYVPAVGETGPDVFGACNGVLEKAHVQHRRMSGGRGVSHKIQPVVPQSATIEKRKFPPTIDVKARVWTMHNDMNHTALSKMAYMVDQMTLLNPTCTAKEIMLVRDHQDCYSCLIAKGKALSASKLSGLRPNIFGQKWSMDYQGEYAVKAIGGYVGRYLFVERMRGYIAPFLVRSKSAADAFECVRKLNIHCQTYGHEMQQIQCDAGTTENAQEFKEKCGLINVAQGKRGIEINPVPINMQERNTVERHVQTFNNNYAAMMVDNELLPPSFWGTGVIATGDTWNKVTNTLCDDGQTPEFYMSGRPTDLKYQFRVGYGKPVVCTRVSKPKGGKQPGTTRNEFGICVGPGGANGAVLVYLPSRGTHAMSLRYHVRKIRFGSTRQRTVEEGRKYLPRLGEDGAWHLVAQGEASELGKQFAALVDDDLTCPIEFDRAEIATHEMDSSIAFDSIMQHLSTMKPKCIWTKLRERRVTRMECRSSLGSMQLSRLMCRYKCHWYNLL